MFVYIIYFLIAVNIMAFTVCAFDKNLAKRRKRRISEKTLFFWSIIGGAIGMFISMLLFHHKTKHWKFMVFIPLLIMAESVLFIYLYISL